MKISYFKDTDTLYIAFNELEIIETVDIDENTTMDINADGKMVAMTVEHASERADLDKITLSGIAA